MCMQKGTYMIPETGSPIFLNFFTSPFSSNSTPLLITISLYLSMAMDLSCKLSYQRLKNENWLEEEDDIRAHVVGGLRHPRPRRVHIKRRLKVKIPRLLTRKGNLVKIVLSKICRRLKESQAHFGDLFAGNYLFMQVTPTPLKKCVDDGLKSFVKNYGFDHGLSSSNYSVNSKINA